jgi:hypothetical protein
MGDARDEAHVYHGRLGRAKDTGETPVVQKRIAMNGRDTSANQSDSDPLTKSDADSDLAFYF